MLSGFLIKLMDVPRSRSRARRGVLLPPRSLFVILLLMLGAWNASAAPNMTAHLERDVVSVGESVTFVLTFEDLSPPGAPNLPAIPNVQFSGVSSSSEITFVNGQQTSRMSYNYTLVPTQPGEYTIPSMQAQAQGKVFRTDPLKLKVVQGAAPGATDPTIGKLAFLQLQVPKSEVYVGEALPLDIILYVVAANDVHMPVMDSDGFTIAKMVQAGQTRTVRDGQVYNILTIKTYATAMRPGQFRLGPVTMQISIPRPNARRSLFGDIYDWREVTLTAAAQTVKALPLPAENIPPDFNGIIGSYAMKVEAGPTKLTVGDPITLKVQISGRGFLEGLNLPSQAQWRDFKFYPAASKVQSNDPLGLTGTKSFEQVVIPQSQDVKLLPSFRFAFFDPELKAYRTVSNAPVALEVMASAASVLPVLTNAGASQTAGPPVDDILFIKSRSEHIALLSPPLLRQPWFLGLQGVPLLTWVSLLAIRKRKEALANNPRLRRQRQVEKRVREGLAELRQHAETRDAEQFFGTLFRLLQEQLGERLDLPASAITEAVIDEHLREKIPGDALEQLRRLFMVCNQFRYAPMKSKQELASLIPKLEGVLQQLQAWEGVAR